MAAADPLDLRFGTTDRTHATERRSVSQPHLEIVHFVQIHRWVQFERTASPPDRLTFWYCEMIQIEVMIINSTRIKKICFEAPHDCLNWVDYYIRSVRNGFNWRAVALSIQQFALSIHHFHCTYYLAIYPYQTSRWRRLVGWFTIAPCVFNVLLVIENLEK